MKNLKLLACTLLCLTLSLGTPACATTSYEAPDSSAMPYAEACFTPLMLENTRLKDHTLFFYDDFYYVVSNHLPLPEDDQTKEKQFVYVRTRDFCTWEDLGTIIGRGPEGAPDEGGVWAPHVIREGDTFYMFYTAFNRHIAQSIMLATSTNPADPQSWVKHGVVFRPHHESVIYHGPDSWSDGRDPMVMRYNDHYLLYYTGQDQHGGIIGVAMADDLMATWHDLGAVFRLPNNMPESPFVIHQDGYFYLFYNASHVGQYWHWAPSPFGPWQSAVFEPRGWAYDFYFDGSQWLASYLVDHGQAIQMQPVRWQTHTSPATPLIHNRVYLPLLYSAE